jgi:DNA-binding MarR family transcriptional regulator
MRTDRLSPTPRQSQVLDFIRGFPLSHEGMLPTLQEIADHFDFSEKRAHDHVRRLECLGLLKRGPSHRSIRVVMPQPERSDSP